MDVDMFYTYHIRWLSGTRGGDGPTDCPAAPLAGGVFEHVVIPLILHMIVCFPLQSAHFNMDCLQVF